MTQDDGARRRRCQLGSGLRRSVAATRENPIAITIVHRSHDLANRAYDNLPTHSRTFGELGCVYQQRRTEHLIGVVGQAAPR